MKIVLVFDGDDTCWMTEWTYGKARAEFFAYLYSIFEELTPGLTGLKDRYDAIDKTLFPVWGVQRGRVFWGMLVLYYEIIDYCRGKFSEEKLAPILAKEIEHNKRIFELGDMPFDFYQHKWFEGAEQVLSEFNEDKKFTLCLLTCYDANVWRERSKFLGVERYFTRIRVISGQKTAENFIQVSGYDSEPEETLFYAVGNATTDILPALEISERWRGIYIPNGSSTPIFDRQGDRMLAPSPLEHPRVITLRSFLELRRVDFENFRLKEPGE